MKKKIHEKRIFLKKRKIKSFGEKIFKNSLKKKY